MQLHSITKNYRDNYRRKNEKGVLCPPPLRGHYFYEIAGHYQFPLMKLLLLKRSALIGTVVAVALDLLFPTVSLEALHMAAKSMNLT